MDPTSSTSTAALQYNAGRAVTIHVPNTAAAPETASIPPATHEFAKSLGVPPALPPLAPPTNFSPQPTATAQLPIAATTSATAPAAADPETPASARELDTSPKGVAARAAREALSAYSIELQRQKKLLPQLPAVTVSFKDVAVSVPVPVVDKGYETVTSKAVDLFTLASWRGAKKTKQFDMIHGASGVVRPGRLTLVLAPPGHGKSTLLKALAGRVTATTGAVRYNGLTRDEALAAGFHINKLVQYIDQSDFHNPLLTVKETFEFAVENFSLDPSQLPDVVASKTADERAQLKKLHDEKAEKMIQLLGLNECANTVLGNALLRGVSGGQKKRVTVGEIMLSEGRVLCLDEPTNGLDSSTALDLFRSLSAWAHVTGGSIVAALQQPTPELYACFDELILLKDGQIAYNGPTSAVLPHFASLGYYCPPDSDFCDWFVELLTHPTHVYSLQNARASVVTPVTSINNLVLEDHKSNDQTEGAIKPAAAAAAPLVPSANGLPHPTNGIELAPLKAVTDPNARSVPFTTEALVSAFNSTQISAGTSTLLAALEESSFKAKAGASILLNDYCRRLYGQPNANSFLHHTKSSFWRQKKLNERNEGLFRPRIIKAGLLSLLLGSLFWNTGMAAFSERIALILFTLAFVAFANSSELPIAVEAKRVQYKQADAGLLPVSSYVISVVLNSVPLAVAEPFVYSVVIYFMTAFTAEAAEFLIFCCVQICSGLCMNVWYRLLAFAAANEDLSYGMAGPSTGIFMLFGGYFITKNSVPNFMIWLYYLSPFSWSVRSLTVNEFQSERYRHFIVPETGVEVDVGKLYLDAYEMDSGNVWVWNGPLLLLGYFFALTALGVVVLTHIRYDLSRGTRRLEEETTAHAPVSVPASAPAAAAVVTIARVPEENGHANGNGTAKHASAAASALPFQPVTLSFHHITYTVNVKGHKKKLLADVSGFAKPGFATALMGASGAGKTTLMDVIAGRKTTGVIEGDILVNGVKVSPSRFARVSGYVEQDDIHSPTSTVRETLLFAANLRLPHSVPSAAKEQFVDEILELLELSDLRDRLIGSPAILGLSPGQLKRVTIGVELVANPPILFLDEPTTGLDSRSAFTVMRVVKKIAASGRAVVCTIHQPSAELFYMFDSLLLLAPGGIQTFFGSIGYRGRSLVHYFEALGAPKKPRRMNAASWMLEAIVAANRSAADAVSVEIKESASDSKLSALAVVSPVAVATTAVAQPQTSTPTPPGVDFGAAYAANPLAKDCERELMAIVSGGSFAANGNAAGGALATAQAELENMTQFAAPISVQFYHYLIRLFRSYHRNVPFTWNRIVILTWLSFIFGLVYFHLPIDTQAGVLSKVGLTFIGTGFCGVIHSAMGLPAQFDARPVFYREQSAKTYAKIVYAVSNFIVEIPVVGVINLVFMCIFYYMAGFEANGELWIRFYFAMYLLSLVYVQMSHLMSACLPNKLSGGLMQSMYFSTFFLFGGLLINGHSIPAGWKWMWHMTPIHHAMESLVMPQFVHANDLISVVNGATTVQMTQSAYVAQFLDFPYDNYWGPIGWLVLIIVAIRVLVIIAVHKISHIKR